MDAELRGELERLRARAYGPDADLGADPVAVARLQELEDLERNARADEAVTAATERVAAVASDPPPIVGDDEPDPDQTEQPRPRRPIVTRVRTLWLWAGSLAAVAAVASAASIAATSFVPVPRTAGVAQIGTLQADPTVDTTAVRSLGFESAEVAGYVDFFGLTAFAGSAPIDAAGNRADCLLLIETTSLADSADDSRFQSGFRYGGCGAGAFPATVEFVVTPDLPDVFRQRFPVGSSVQFVRDGERVGVFSDAE